MKMMYNWVGIKISVYIHPRIPVFWGLSFPEDETQTLGVSNMSGSTVGKMIAAFRERTGISQGEFGKRLNVSAQAVSRWERGGMPDTALLPRIAEIIGCSLDDLYNITTARIRTMEELLTQELRETPTEQRMQRAVQLAWHLMKLNGSTVVGDGADPTFAAATACEDADKDERSPMGPQPTNCYFSSENGLMYSSVASKFKYVMFMQEPEDGFASIMNGIHDYQKLFSLFGREYRLAVYLLGFSLPPNKQFTRNYVCTQLGLSPEQAQEILDELCEYRMLNFFSIQEADHCVCTYAVPENAAIVPFLYFGKTLMRDGKSYVLCARLRESPMFRAGQPMGAEASAWTPGNSKEIARHSPWSRAKDQDF